MEPADLNYSNWICVNQYQIIPPPRQYPDSFRQPKTTLRNLSDTLQTPQNRKLNGQSRVIERKGTSRLKQYSMFLHWSFNNWFGMITIQAVPRVIQTPSRHLFDTIRHIADNPKSIFFVNIYLRRLKFYREVQVWDISNYGTFSLISPKVHCFSLLLASVFMLPMSAGHTFIYIYT